MSSLEMISFGREIRDKCFLYDPESLNLNHASRGGVPKPVWDARIREMKKVEFQPDSHYRRNLVTKWFDNLKVAAKFLGSKEENLVFVENATSGVNAVVKSLSLKQGESILVNSWSYMNCQNACTLAARRAGASVVTWNLKYPIKSKEEVVENFKKFLDENPEVKLAMIDLIASATAVKFPVEEMIAVCKSHGVLVLVDGAHGPGQLELNLETLGADFFTGSLHKWLYVAHGCAILWVHPNFHKVIKPVLTTAILDHEDFRYAFYSQATRDYSPYLCVKEAVEFYQQLGGHSVITGYNSALVEKAADHLAKVWGTERFPIPSDMQPPNMRLVCIPAVPSYPLEVPSEETVFFDYKSLMDALFYHFNAHCACFSVQGEAWLRISANVYNSMEEYEKLGQLVLELM